MSAQHTPGPYSIHPFSAIQERKASADGSYEHAALTIGAGKKVLGEVRFATAAAGYPLIDDEEEMRAVAALWIAAPELYTELFLARDAVAETRRCIFESHTVRDDPATLEDEVKAEVENLDAQLARIDAALSKARGEA